MRRFAFTLLALMVFAQAAVAQAPAPSRPFSVVLAEWSRILDEIERYVRAPDHTPERSREYRALALKVAEEATKARDAAQAKLEQTQRLLDALGPPPAEGEPPEDESVASKRRQYEEDIAAYRARVSLADLTVARANELERTIARLTRQSLLERLTTRHASPLAPRVIARAVPELAEAVGQIVASPVRWYASLSAEEQAQVRFWPVALVAAIAAGFGWAIRRLLLGRFGRDPAQENPSFARRLAAAIAEGLARGIVPALIIGGFYFMIASESARVSGPFAEVARSLSVALMFFVTASALARAVLAPDLPAWRLLPLAPEASRKISHRIVALAAVFAVDVFFRLATEGRPLPEDLAALYLLITNTLEALGVLALLPARLWVVDRAAPEREEGDEEAAADGVFWRWLRRGAGLIAVAGVVATVAGYLELGAYLIKNLLYAGVVFSVLFIVRGLLREGVGMATRSRLAREVLGLKAGTRQALKFWVRAALDPLLLGAGVYAVAPALGVPLADLTRWTTEFLRGFQVGNVTISLVDIVLGILAFTAVLALTRMIQRSLAERVLPQTHLHPSVQHSVTAAIGYLGFLLATVIGFATLGFDLSNLALIAGALSVGIGFGLQNVVNNFVSGLILLVERPIKVGDWVVVGNYEGYVKRIKVRATELETFQRASVIIPNSELLSSAVVNWTHTDKYGRCEVRVGVAYGSDTHQVRDILLACARAHPRVAPWPEPSVIFRDFGDSALIFDLRAYLYDVEWVVVVASDLRFAIEAKLREAGIEIPFPQRDLHLRDIERLERALKGADEG